MPGAQAQSGLFGSRGSGPGDAFGQLDPVDLDLRVDGGQAASHVHGMTLAQLAAVLGEQPSVLHLFLAGTRRAWGDTTASVTTHPLASAREGGLPRDEQGEEECGEPGDHAPSSTAEAAASQDGCPAAHGNDEKW